MILLYLIAIVLANLSVAFFGPPAVIVNAFFSIGLSLTTRDKLHNRWRGNGLAFKMAALVATGSLLTWALNRDAGRIALASVLAFSLSATTDTLVYHRTNSVAKSNVASAIVDSIVFPWLAFGTFMPLITAGQALAKICGGAIWALILFRRKANDPR